MSKRPLAHGPGIAISLFALLAASSARAEDPPDPSQLGPWKVGHREEVVVEPPHLPQGLTPPARIFFDIWYPMDAADWDSQLLRAYFLSNLIFTVLEVESEVAMADGAVSSAGPFPLVVFSHGAGSAAIQSIVLCETLASHGVVVIGPTHYADNIFDDATRSFSELALQRPQDVSFSLDYILGRSADPADDFFDSVNPNQIGITGHSFGGFTALAVVGGYDDGTTFLPPDSRVRATLPVSPATSDENVPPDHLLEDPELIAVTAPTLLLSGTLDTVTPIDPDTTRPWSLISTPANRKFRVDVIDATHTHFANICDFGEELIEEGICPDGAPDPETGECAEPTQSDPFQNWVNIGAGALVQPYKDTCIPPALELAEVKRLQNLYTVSFFKVFLGHDARYRSWLTTDYALANEPGVIFFGPSAQAVPGLSVGGLALLGMGLVGAGALRRRRGPRDGRS